MSTAESPELVSLYRAGRETGLDPVLLYHWVKRGKLVPRDFRPRGERMVALTTIDDVLAAAVDRRDLAGAADRASRAADLYEPENPDGPSLDQVGAELGVSGAAVLKYLKRENVARRPRTAAAGAARRRALELVKRPGELTALEVAKLASCSPITVARLVRLGKVTSFRVVDGDDWHAQHGSRLFDEGAVDEIRSAIAEGTPAAQWARDFAAGTGRARAFVVKGWVGLTSPRAHDPGWVRQILARNAGKRGGAPRRYTDLQARGLLVLRESEPTLGIRRLADRTGLTPKQVRAILARKG